MQYFRGSTAAEIIAVRIDADEDLVPMLNQVVSELSIAAGVVLSGSGMLERIALEQAGTVTWPPAALAVEKNGPGQIVAAQGHIYNGELELNLTIARRNEMFAGKAMPGSLVAHYAEFTILRAGSARWTRSPHPQTGAPLLQSVSAAPPPPGQEITLMGRPIDPQALALVPTPLIRKHSCLPVAKSGDTLVVAMADPNNPFAIDDLRNTTGLRIQTVAVPARDLHPALAQVLAQRGT